MTKTPSKSFLLSSSKQKSPFFAVLMYALYGHPRYFKFKEKYQQYGPCFQAIFPFLMTMAIHRGVILYYLKLIVLLMKLDGVICFAGFSFYCICHDPLLDPK